MPEYTRLMQTAGRLHTQLTRWRLPLGVLLALVQRIREIGKGEEDAYRNY